MKTFSERRPPTQARRAAAWPEAQHGAPAGAGAHARGTAQRERIDSAFGAPVQRMGDEEELQMKAAGTLQRQEDEEELLQGRFDPVQRLEDEEEEPLQARADAGPAPGAEAAAASPGGMPAGLRSGIKALSGMDLSDVQVHTGSSKPAGIRAHAYTQGNDIYVAPGQEQHLAHEAWHVVQQRQGRVAPTMELGGVGINDDAGLEAETDRMGEQAKQAGGGSGGCLDWP